MLLSIKKYLKNGNPWLMVMFAVALTVRLGLFWGFLGEGDHAWLCYDSQQYDERARSIVTHHKLTDDNSMHKAYRLPGYPLFLACWYALAENGVKLALYIQILIASLIPLLVFLLAQPLFPFMPIIAYVAGWVMCFHVGFVASAGMLATESLAVLLLLLMHVVLLGWRGNMHYLAFAGGLLGLLSLIRPIGHYIVVLVACWLFWQLRSYKRVSVFVASWFIVVLPLLVRNLLVVGGICFHTLPGMHFLQYSAVAVVMQRDQVSYNDARSQLLAKWDDEVVSNFQQQEFAATEYQRCVLGEKLAWSIIRQYPWYACKHAATELFKTLCALHGTHIIVGADIGSLPVYTAQTTWTEKVCYNIAPPLKTQWLQGLIYWDIFNTIIILFFSVVGLVLLLLRRQMHAGLVLCVLVAGLLWVITLSYGCARLRLPFEPIMIILGVYGGYAVWCWLTNKKTI